MPKLKPRVILQLPLSNEALLDDFVERCLSDRIEMLLIVGSGASRIEDIIMELTVGDGSDPDRFIHSGCFENGSVNEARKLFAELAQTKRSEVIRL